MEKYIYVEYVTVKLRAVDHNLYDYLCITTCSCIVYPFSLNLLNPKTHALTRHFHDQPPQWCQFIFNSTIP